ncbi:MAG: tRNA glutamyl-Q(34) synthetase GluQRS [Muribaculaceae bacterium]|nr:tRNA glutamyl-Q(34) synthetase GluQRS [Muribaculaceae bacterium]
MKRADIDGIVILSQPLGDSTLPRREQERRVVRQMLSEYYGRDVAVSHHPDGAPFLSDIHDEISISHSADQVVIAIGQDKCFGIDTETLRPQLERVKEKFLNPDEQQLFPTLADKLWAWSAKEAVYKAARSEGLPLKNIRLVGDYATVDGGGVYRLTTVDCQEDSLTILAKGVTPKGRFAPSPSGRMHLGNIFSAVMSYLSVKSRGGKWILRIEDLDPQRSKEAFSRQIEDDLLWLGLEWDEGGLADIGPDGPYRQSRRSDIYEEYLNRLKATGYTYPCRCTRAEIMATQAPHSGDSRVVYGGNCRPATLPAITAEPADPHATRLYVPDREITFVDRTYGVQSTNLATDSGDFIVRRADGAWAYQLAVVVDDALMDVTEVVRGSDLLMSSAQQIYLYHLLGLNAPEWAHVPLLTAADGRRLAKRDRSMAMDSLRELYTPEQLLGRVARLAGFNPSGAAMSLPELLAAYQTPGAVMAQEAD